MNPTIEAGERSKYEIVWAHDDYRRAAPGMHHAKALLARFGTADPRVISDLGCGTGRPGLWLAQHGHDVRLVDITETALDRDVLEAVHRPDKKPPGSPLVSFWPGCFWRGDWQPVVQADWVFTTDAMEHCPTSMVGATFAQMAQASEWAYVHVCCCRDSFGPRLIGEPLHLTIQPMEWWRDVFAEWFHVESAERDGDGATLIGKARGLLP